MVGLGPNMTKRTLWEGRAVLGSRAFLGDPAVIEMMG